MMSNRAAPYFWSSDTEDFFCRSCGARIDITDNIATCPNDCWEAVEHE